MTTLLLLWAAHFVADFPLQGDFVARYKNRWETPSMMGHIWPWCMTAHAASHALAVGLITGSTWLALAEFVVHWIIDYGKCARWFGFHADQVLHLAFKVPWALAVIL